MANKFDIQRLKQLEFLLRWEGQIGNARLREIFGISSVRASQLIKEFRDYQPRWIRLNSITKTYDATQEFYRDAKKEDSESLADYLSLVGLPAAHHSPDSHVVAAFQDFTTPNPHIFALLSSAARMGRVVEITYQSMKEPTPHKRVIHPHSVVRAGRRWHVRAYSELNKQFRDYTLGRIKSAKVLDQPAEFTMKDDNDWMTEVHVRLIAHPDLSIEQESVIRFEYFNSTAARVTICRGPLVSYFIQEMRAAVDVKTQRPPEYQLAVENLKEVRKWLFPS